MNSHLDMIERPIGIRWNSKKIWGEIIELSCSQTWFSSLSDCSQLSRLCCSIYSRIIILSKSVKHPILHSHFYFNLFNKSRSPVLNLGPPITQLHTCFWIGTVYSSSLKTTSTSLFAWGLFTEKETMCNIPIPRVRRRIYAGQKYPYVYTLSISIGKNQSTEARGALYIPT